VKTPVAAPSWKAAATFCAADLVGVKLAIAHLRPAAEPTCSVDARMPPTSARGICRAAAKAPSSAVGTGAAVDGAVVDAAVVDAVAVDAVAVDAVAVDAAVVDAAAVDGAAVDGAPAGGAAKDDAATDDAAWASVGATVSAETSPRAARAAVARRKALVSITCCVLPSPSS
jgi:hypothetical protein